MQWAPPVVLEKGAISKKPRNKIEEKVELTLSGGHEMVTLERNSIGGGRYVAAPYRRSVAGPRTGAEYKLASNRRKSLWPDPQPQQQQQGAALPMVPSTAAPPSQPLLLQLMPPQRGDHGTSSSAGAANASCSSVAAAAIVTSSSTTATSSTISTTSASSSSASLVALHSTLMPPPAPPPPPVIATAVPRAPSVPEACRARRERLLRRLDPSHFAGLAFLEDGERGELALDGVATQHAAAVGAKMGEVRDALATGGKAAERVERRLGVMARHIADQLLKARSDQRAAEADDADVAEELAVRLENLSGVISAPLQLREPEQCSAALIQVSYHVVLHALMALHENLLMGGTLGVELLDHISAHALLHLLLNVTMGSSMHDPEFAFADPELAAVNGVGGGSWDGFRRKAWLVAEYPMMDLCFHGYNYEHTKEKVSTAAGFAEGAFFEMGQQTWALVREVLRDFEPEYWDLCFDVCSAAYLGHMAQALGRHLPTDITPPTMDAQKALGGQYDFYFALPKLVILLLSTRWDGAYKDKNGNINYNNQGRTGAAIALVLLPNGVPPALPPLLPSQSPSLAIAIAAITRSISPSAGGFLMRAYELPPPHHRDFAGMQGSHLVRTHMVYSLTGEIDDAAVERAKPPFEARLERARAALRRRAAGVDFAEIDGARRLVDTSSLLDRDAEYFAAWRAHSALEWTMEEELRPGSDAHVRQIAAATPRARCLANLAPARAIAPPAASQLSMRDALELRELRCEPRPHPRLSEDASSTAMAGKTRAAQRAAEAEVSDRPVKRVTRVSRSDV